MTAARPKTALRRWILRLSAAALIIMLGGVTAAILGCETMIAHAIADAPNKNRSHIPVRPQAELQKLGVHRELRIETNSGAELAAWIIDPAAPTAPRGTILVIHGVRDSKRSQIGLGKSLADVGYRAVLIDLRGHGDSTGDFLSYGVRESRDLSAVLDELQRTDLLAGEVGIVAASYGAACGIQLAAIDSRVKAIVAVATFTSLRDVIPSYLRRARIHWLVSNAALDRAFQRVSTLANFDVDDASPLRAIAATSAPVLLIHGENDSHIPPDHSRRLHEAAGGESKLVLIPGEDHDTIMGDRQDIIKREMLAWLDMHLQ